MKKENDEILKGLKTAMEAELTGHEFYKNSAKNIKDPDAAAVLTELAEEELSHFNYLRHQYKSILKSGNYDFARRLTKKARDMKESPIFSQAIKERIKESHYEVSVITIAMKLELDAMKFYRSCAQSAGTKEASEFYDELAKWELGHYEAFERELNMIKEEYWQANNFIPM
jgi:rubrerythrin